MSFQEIDSSYRREIQSSIPRIDEAARKFGSMVKKTRLYPIRHSFTIMTKDKTKLHLLFTASKRSKWDSPRLCIYSTFRYNGGIYAISIDGPEGTSQIYTQHFFERYRERIVKDYDINSEDLIKRFMIKNSDMMWYRNTQAFSTAYQNYERENITQLAARVEEGNCFVERIDKKILLLKTIISDDMLGDYQSEAFAVLEQMRKDYAAKALTNNR